MLVKKIRKKIRYLLRRHPFLHRVRFALITKFADRKLFDNEYSNKYCEEIEIPDEFHDVIARLGLRSDITFESAKRIAFDLSHGHKRGGTLGCASVTALRSIYNNNGGVCSDYSQVYLGLCIAAGIKVREWGISENFSMSLGHAFNEIHSTEFNKWIFLDASRSIYATDKRTSLPLGVTEIIDLTTSALSDRIEFHYIDDGRRGKEGHPHAHLYLNPSNVFFLISYKNFFKQDKFLRWTAILPLPFLHILMLVLGSYQEYYIYTNSHNMELMRHKFNILMRSFSLTALRKGSSDKRYS